MVLRVLPSIFIETLRAGEAFAAQKAAEGYTRTASGMLYRITEPGVGEPCADRAKAIVNLVGRHIDGEAFMEPDEAMPLEYHESIDCLAELEPLMKEGMKLVAVVPADLAYGYDGQADWGDEWIVRPGETLIYEIEVVSTYSLDDLLDVPESEQ